MDEVLRWIGNALLFVSGLEALAFVIVYQVTADWRRSELGRHLMTFMGVFAAVLILSTVRILAGGDAMWFAVLRLIVFAGVPYVLGWRLWLLYKTQREARKIRTEGRPMSESRREQEP